MIENIILSEAATLLHRSHPMPGGQATPPGAENRYTIPMLRFIRSTLTPSAYHGHGRRPPFFEGWYFKLVSADRSRRWVAIPGIFKSQDPAKAHAFVQVLDGQTGSVSYHRYPVGDFWAAADRFEIRIGPNAFSAEALRLDIDGEGRRIRGALRFTGGAAWPVSLISPGIMGWYAWVPKMETYHGVVSLDHEIQGALEIDGETAEFSGGRGYIEKDWGRSFPAAWVWMQSNHFSRPGACLTASVAVIPWMRSAFGGYIVGLWHERQLHTFSTYNGARVETLAVAPQHIEWTLRNRTHRLEIRAHRQQAALLQAPTLEDMGRRIPETLQAAIDVRLYALAGGEGQLVWEDTGECAGLEVVGDIERLVRMVPQTGAKPA
ncbi:MAG TPA: tocopherol cyclase family protein [Anaerolineaceae bacterium]|nr:tocopherol cyclase family protein [Anaerolineaceae bacterium]